MFSGTLRTLLELAFKVRMWDLLLSGSQSSAT
jgi:hypothetical protein